MKVVNSKSLEVLGERLIPHYKKKQCSNQHENELIYVDYFN